MYNYSKQQYEFVRDSRYVLIEYCKTITPQDFTNENSSFGRGGSIRNLLVHIANTYEFWIGKCALTKDIVFTTYQSQQNIQDVINLFLTVDAMMNECIELMQQPAKLVQYEQGGEKKSGELFRLFTHVITHEYHHKGQILSLSRHLGYLPVDTDIMR